MTEDPRIPAQFGAIDGELALGGRPASDWVAEASDTPLFVYDRRVIVAKIEALRAALPPEVELHYAVKANPMQSVVDFIAPRVDGLDVASAGELEIAVGTGIEPSGISFAGPGKRDRELAAAIDASITLNIESAGELERAAIIAAERGKTLHAALRVNPPFDLKASGMRMGGGAKPFGIDAEQVPVVLRRLAELGADFQGFHVFAGSQNLSAESLIDAQVRTIGLVAELAEHASTPPPTANIGGGFGLPYFPGDLPLDIKAVGRALGEALQRRPAVLQGTRFIVELGRYIVGDCGVYLTRIVDRKISDGQIFLITDGGLHHQLAASGNFGTVIRRNYPLANASRYGAPTTETANVVGCLCTPLDRLGDKIELPESQVGDLIAVFMAGAYGRTASPANFLGHPGAGEILV